MIHVKRVYDPASADDGARFLVDRLWPRGVRKDALRLEAWVKDVAPSDGLRKWFAHDPTRWTEFQKKYLAELKANPEAWKPLAEAARRGRVTLLFAARDLSHNNAVALREFLLSRIKRRRPG